MASVPTDHIAAGSRPASIRDEKHPRSIHDGEKPSYAEAVEKNGGIEAQRSTSSSSERPAQQESGKFKELYHRYGGKHIVRAFIGALFTG